MGCMGCMAVWPYQSVRQCAWDVWAEKAVSQIFLSLDTTVAVAQLCAPQTQLTEQNVEEKPPPGMDAKEMKQWRKRQERLAQPDGAGCLSSKAAHVPMAVARLW